MLTGSMSFDANDKSIEEILFSTFKYRVPAYQRPYAWEDDEIEEFWNDLNFNHTSYFIGSFIFNYETFEKDKTIEVIDGQQRLLTITIFIAVIRDCLKELNAIDDAKRYQTKCIAFEDLGGDQTFRIEAGESTKEFFENNIQDGNADIAKAKTKSKEDARIQKAYLLFKERIGIELSKIKDTNDQIKYLKKLVGDLSQVKAIWIKIESEEDAYEIFETVNARGVELTVSDLLKNLIFKMLKSKSKQAERTLGT